MRRAVRRGAAAVALAVLASAAAAAVGFSAAPAAATGNSIPVVGHGWGHGRGMGQYGAYGYSLAGQSASWILDHFYGGTTAATVPDQLMSVRLMSEDAADLVVTSQAPFVVGGFDVGATRVVRLTVLGDGRYQAFVSTACGSSEVYTWILNPDSNGALTIRSSNAAPGDDLTQMLTICGGPTYRGSFRFLYGDGLERTVNMVSLEDYTRGVVPRESPASWPAPALQAQAVASRSYGLAEGRTWYAKTCDTTSCQVYGGAGSGGVRREAPGSDAAVAATAGQVRLMSTGEVAHTVFSASTGGWTAGGTFPAVPDDGDATSINPFHTWTTQISISSLETTYGLGTFQGIEVTARNGFGDFGGRTVNVRIRGTSTTVNRTGNQFRIDWDLRSDWFDFHNPFLSWQLRNTNGVGSPDLNFVYGAPPAGPVACDWDGNGSGTVGIYDSGYWYVRNANTAGAPDLTIHYGAPGYVPVCGDWDGNGTQTIGVYVNGRWLLRNSNTPGPPDLVFDYGAPGYTPVVGNWDGTGGDGIGVYVDGRWLLRNTVGPGLPDAVFDYGARGYTPVVGNWDGAGGDSIGVYVGGRWLLRNSTTPGSPDVVFDYGAPAYRPIAADWDGDGSTTAGVVVPPT